jgi:hypothetical protein
VGDCFGVESEADRAVGTLRGASAGGAKGKVGGITPLEELKRLTGKARTAETRRARMVRYMMRSCLLRDIMAM